MIMESNVADISSVSRTTRQVIAEVERAVVGKRALLEMMMASMLAGGHVLLEDYPGLGKTLIAPDLDKVGYRLVGGRLLPAIEGPAAQLMYEDDEGGRLTVYLRADPASRETAFAFARVNGVNGFRWVDRGFGYAIFGDADHDRMLLAAKAVYEQIEAI